MAKAPLVRMPPQREKPAPDPDAEARFVAGATSLPRPEKKEPKRRGRPPGEIPRTRVVAMLPNTLVQQIELVIRKNKQTKAGLIELAVNRYVAEELGLPKRKPGTAKDVL
jgi:hypothetical protein